MLSSRLLAIQGSENQLKRIYGAVSYEGCMLTIALWCYMFSGAPRGKTVSKHLNNVAEAGVFFTEAIFCLVDSERGSEGPVESNYLSLCFGGRKYKNVFEACV